MKNIFLVLFLSFFFSENTYAKKITPDNLINNIDICSIGSSLGPTCKEIPFDPTIFFKKGKKIIKDQSVHYEFDNWDYYFKILEQKNDEAIIEFEDNAKQATYLSVQLIKLKFNKEQNQWKTISTKTIYPKSEAQNNFILVNNNNIDYDALVEFDGICVQNIQKLDVINSYAKIQNWRELSPDLDAMNAPQVKGTIYKSYGYVKNDEAYMVAINNPEDVFTCSLAAKYFDIIKFKKFLSEFYKVKLVNKSSQGVQTQEIYEANIIQSNKAFFVLMYSHSGQINSFSITIMAPNE